MVNKNHKRVTLNQTFLVTLLLTVKKDLYNEKKKRRENEEKYYTNNFDFIITRNL